VGVAILSSVRHAVGDGGREAESSLVTEVAVDTDLNQARAGDEAAFTRLVQPLRRELHAHCYRMLGSTYDADDALQDALIRAWRGLSRFEGRSSLRSWLYTVATRTCLDTAEKRGKRALPVDLSPASDQVTVHDTPLTEIAWLGPYPGEAPEAHYEQREAVELAFVAALQHLPGNQRAALLLFEVLGFTAAEIAEMMDTSTTSVNSALARARRLVAEKVPASAAQRPAEETREIVAKYAKALEQGDAAALVALLTEDVTWSMPPMGHWYRGVDQVMDFVAKVPLTCGSWHHVPVTANAQPAVASYLSTDPSEPHRAWSINVLTIREGRIAEVTAFIGEEHFAPFGLPVTASPLNG
jgi:RNA polymerase sigma-70 factor (ECF subfamily)